MFWRDTLINSEIQKFLINTDMSKSLDDNRFSSSLKSLTNAIEKILVEHAVDLSHGSQVKAASLLGISSSSLCRKRKESKILQGI
ncbi:MAG: helix-turn-helix domain-containing protein [Gammaproteobacteria bacterium]|nr:helix-turn-helix domain-containing protein [Gammaproteobacteria bacterium]